MVGFMFLKKIFLLLTILTSSALAEVTANDPETFECTARPDILRGNKYCIQATDIAKEYTENKPLLIPITQDKQLIAIATITSSDDNDGHIKLDISHKCRSAKGLGFDKESNKKSFLFCGYAKSQIDKTSDAAKEIRDDIIKNNNLSEAKDSAKIDDLVAQNNNTWIADPAENISQDGSKIKIRILQNSLDTTCKGEKELFYDIHCESGIATDPKRDKK